MKQACKMDDRVIIDIDNEIVLKQLTKEDALPYFELVDCNRAHLNQFGDITLEKYPDPESVIESIVEPSENPKKLHFGIWKEETIVGSINIQSSNGSDTVMRIGYWLGHEFIGEKFASRFVKALVHYVFHHHNCSVVVASANQKNFEYIRVLRACGFVETLEGYSPKENFYMTERN